MKKKILFLGFLTTVMAFTACTNDSDTVDDDNNLARLQADVEEITNDVTSGSWVITNFIDSDKNETANFTGFGFSFNSDGSLIADNGSDTVTGTWSITIDDDSNDDSNDDDSSDDSNDDDCNSCTISQLTDVLTACTNWYVEKLERNDSDLESNFNGYDFNFAADGTVTVASGNETYSGTWTASGNGNNIQVVLTIMDLMDIGDTWTLHEIELANGESQVDLRIDGNDRLRFRNNCTIGNFSGGTSSGDIDFNIFFASPVDFSELSEDWDIITNTGTKIELIHVSGGNGGTDLLTFEKN
jgi:hypothetical protein